VTLNSHFYGEIQHMSKFKITNQLLKDAVTDAEMLRQTAITNAKITLEEEFTPQIKAMLARRLRAESYDEDEDEKETEKKDMKDESVIAGPTEETAKEQPFQDATHVSGGGPQGTSAIGSTDNKEPSDAAADSSDIDQGGEGESDSHTDWYDDWSESDFDLDEVIRELEEEVASHSDDDDEEEEMDENWSEGEEKEVEKLPAATPAGVHTSTVPANTSGIGKEATMGAPTDPSDVNKFVTDPSVPKHEMQGMAAPTAGHEGGEEELDLEAILRELEAEEDDEQDDSEQMAHKVEALQQELAEYRKVVNVLRGKLQEINLLNAKLLFTNKLFNNKSLTSEQKIAIVENFDRAKTVREAKIVYTTLVETLNTAARAMKRPAKTAKVVAEGLASKATPSTAPKKAEILEENTLAKRLQQLAGIL
jgi:hypothetical protein